MRFAHGTGSQLDDRMCGETRGHAPGGHTAPYFSHALGAVHVDQVDREPHANGMHRFTRNDPQPFSCFQAIASQQPLVALGGAVRYVHTVGKDRLTGEVHNLPPYLRLAMGSRQEAVEYLAWHIHSVAFERSLLIGASLPRHRQELQPRSVGLTASRAV